ncbi:MAG: hypothetical protein GDA54_06840, partial [Alphaproteobacteria bacterium GM7ARS4]|nr:hypothetical protein [Alphaproteobacteria bacterium GM7ARS4]
MDYPEFTFMRHAGQRHSGCGEEGILHWLFDACHGERGVFVEFGAWDGIHLSNSRFFFERGWSGVFIEGDKKRFWQFSSNYREHPSVKTLCAFVEVEGHNSLDNLLARAEVTAVDLLSIDIDGIDLAIWKSLKTLRPRVVCIEYNVSIPFDTRYESTPHARDRGRGNSALSTYDYAESHNYVLVGVTSNNLIFMDRKKRPDGIDVLDFSQCQECVRLFYPSVKTRVAFSNRGEMFFIEEDGTRHDGEIFYVPCAGFYATQ